jgi:hypothetical protein
MGDADGHRAEHHRRNDHADDFDERVTQRLQRHACLRKEQTEQDAQHGRNQHLDIEQLEGA